MFGGWLGSCELVTIFRIGKNKQWQDFIHRGLPFLPGQSAWGPCVVLTREAGSWQHQCPMALDQFDFCFLDVESETMCRALQLAGQAQPVCSQRTIQCCATLCPVL